MPFPTLLIGGVVGGSATLIPLRLFLTRSGIDARLWHTMPALSKPVGSYAKRLAERLRHGPPGLSIVAWSLGGMIVLEALADERAAAKVKRVITFGTPFDGATAAELPRSLGLAGFGSELAPGSILLGRARKLIRDRSRTWDFLALNGRDDFVARAPQRSLPETCRIEGPWDHFSILHDLRLFDQFAKHIRRP